MTTPTILVVDDGHHNRLLLGGFLKVGGYTNVRFAESAKDAFSRLGLGTGGSTDDRTDLILMDVMMPDMDGIEACRRLKSDHHLRDVPVIMVTALHEVAHLERAFDAGAVDYVIKPVNKIELLARVRSALRLKREMDVRKQRERDLQKALDEVKVLRGIIPICASCKQIRNHKGYWEAVEVYIQKRSDALFSHGICGGCIKKLYPELYAQNPSLYEGR